MAGRKEIPRELSIYINDKAVVNSLRGITGEITRTNNEMKNLNKNSATYDEDLKKLQGNLSELKNKQADFKEEIYATDKAASDATGSFSKLYSGLISGDLITAKEGLLGIKAELTGLVKSSLAFIATPIGAAIAVLAGFAAGAKAIFDFNQQAEKSAVLIENLSGKTGQVVEDIRVKMQALTDTFGLTFDQLAGAVDNLVDTGVAKDELEALDKIKNGLLTAPDKNEFITSLESSAVIAKQVGLTLEEVIALKKQIETTGVDPEATFGALQKASQKLEVQADSLRITMTNALGAAFTDDVLARIKTGEITTVQALDLINKKSKEVGLNQTQQAELAKEMFGKSALAAGGFSTVLETVTGGLKKQKEELNANQKALLELNNANEKLNKAQSELFRVKDFGELWTKIKTSATNSIVSIINYILDLKKGIQPLIDLVEIALVNAWVILKTIVVGVFDVISGVLKGFSNGLTTIVGIVKKLLTGDLLGAVDILKKGFVSFSNIVENTFGKVKNTIIDGIKAIVSNVAPFLDAIGFDINRIQKGLDSFKSKEVVLKTSSQSGSTGTNPEKVTTTKTAEELAIQQALRDAARQKEADARKVAADKKKAEQDKADKIEQDKLLALAKAKGDLAKAELAYFISNNKSKLDNTKALTPEIVQEETTRLESVKDQQLTALAEERLAKVEKAESEAKSAEELVALKQTIDYDYETNRQNLELGFQASTDALKKQYVEEQKVLAAEQLQADNELALAEADTKEQEDTIKRQQDYKAQLAEYKKLFDEKTITEEEYGRFKKAAKLKQDEMDRVLEIQKVQGTLGGLNQLAGAVGELFGQSKELAIVQAGINGAMAVTSILAQYPKFDGGFAMTAAIVAAGLSTVAQVAKITKAKAPKTPKFFYGGPTGTNALLGHDEFGPMTGIVHKNEYVIPESMTQSPRYANTISWLEQERTGRFQKFANGGETSPGVVGASGTLNSDQLYNAIATLNTILSSGIMAKLFIGYDDAKRIEELNKERLNSASYSVLNE